MAALSSNKLYSHARPCQTYQHSQPFRFIASAPHSHTHSSNPLLLSSTMLPVCTPQSCLLPHLSITALLPSCRSNSSSVSSV